MLLTTCKTILDLSNAVFYRIRSGKYDDMVTGNKRFYLLESSGFLIEACFSFCRLKEMTL